MSRPIVVLTSYPGKGRLHDRRTVGGAAYTKRLLAALRAAAPGLAIEVIGEVLDGEMGGPDEGIQVTRAWRRGSIVSVSRAVLLALRRPADTVLVSYEVNMVGGKAANLAFLLLLFLARLRGKRVLFILHQAVDRLDGLEPGRTRALALAAGKAILHRLISLASSGSIVFEEPLRSSLPFRERTAVVPFGVEDPLPLDGAAARRRLGLEPGTFAILSFGFLSPYKGLDRLLEILDLPRLSRELGGGGARLIIAGDGNPNHRGDRRYRRSLASLKERARERGALLPGFIEEEEIGLYYTAADVVIFPYRVFFSSSYSLALAFAYERPVLLSRPLARYFEGADFREAARAADLSPEDLVFDSSSEDLLRKLLALAANREKHLRFSRSMKRARRWSDVAPRLLEVLEAGGGPAGAGRASP